MTDTTQAAGLTIDALMYIARKACAAAKNSGVCSGTADMAGSRGFAAERDVLLNELEASVRAALAAQAVPAKWVDAVCNAAFDEEGWTIDPDLAEVHAEMLASPAPAEAKEEPKPHDPPIEYRYEGGTHWCPLGPAERMKPDFKGVYRVAAGKYPVEHFPRVKEEPLSQQYLREQVEKQMEGVRAALTTKPVAEVAQEHIFFLRKRSNGSRWPAGTKLYAASPAVVEALERALAFLESIHKSGYSPYEPGYFSNKASPNYELIDQIVSQGRAALQLDGDK